VWAPEGPGVARERAVRVGASTGVCAAVRASAPRRSPAAAVRVGCPNSTTSPASTGSTWTRSVRQPVRCRPPARHVPRPPTRTSVRAARARTARPSISARLRSTRSARSTAIVACARDSTAVNVDRRANGRRSALRVNKRSMALSAHRTPVAPNAFRSLPLACSRSAGSAIARLRPPSEEIVRSFRASVAASPIRSAWAAATARRARRDPKASASPHRPRRVSAGGTRIVRAGSSAEERASVLAGRRAFSKMLPAPASDAQGQRRASSQRLHRAASSSARRTVLISTSGTAAACNACFLAASQF
jgi:hypothetical protein